MRYAGLNKNDFCAAPGVSVTFYTQGCPHRCQGCHNPQTWDFDSGKEFIPELLDEIISALTCNGIERNLCIQGGEPLCPENEFLTLLIIKTVKEKLPDTKIYVWTGYTYDRLPNTPYIKQILSLINCLIDGPYIQEERDITLPMRGSRNQNIIYFDNN
jgi:anaerobic ribonucleoside-triphosphate reductase activating protein